ncbi:FAD-dependent oxidoreductase [Herbidospora sp. NBRC 101105]|uniref:NAD(P)/FAD-dependent oxidoreductase n=1 Tax=Herbidospora sp. NBRC 101105 TaxID=3032195 RepID=UPI0024A21F7A|nr:FAD-dependent oxidoreductase [Herbidospora sp. NBRC 101105]GLX95146.1 dehydrogenase [Herbidospora sp. NBRC 101105]
MQIVVIGAGYAGTYAANILARKTKADITVVNPRGHFVERVRLHQRVSGTSPAHAPLTSMLRAGITTRIGTVEKIGDGLVTLDDGASLEFDLAVLAVGSTAQPMPGTIPAGTWEGAEQARAALATLPSGAVVTVIGGGPTGIETAAEIAAARPDLRVRLVGTAVAGGFTEGPRRRVRAGLDRLRVEVVEDGVTAVADGQVVLRSGTALATDLTLWGIVSGVPDLAARSGLTVDEEGRLVVDEFLRSVDDPRVFAAGDCAAVPGARMSCQASEPQGATAALNVARTIQGRELTPHVVRFVAVCVSLGRADAVAQFTHFDDSPRRAYLAGRTGAVLKEQVTRGTVFGAKAGIPFR